MSTEVNTDAVEAVAETKAQTSKPRGRRKSRQGLVVSDKMDKTIVVQVSRLVKHPIYKKYVRSRVNYKAHDPRNEAKTGDQVMIEECRPMSRDKRWRLEKITRKAAVI